MFLNAGEHSHVERLCVKSLGYDRDKSMWCFVADTSGPLVKGAILHNKDHDNILKMDTYSHNENQAFDVTL